MKTILVRMTAVLMLAFGLVSGATAADASDGGPSVGVQIVATGVAIEGKTYGYGDAATLRAKLDEIRARVPKPRLELSLADGVTDPRSEKGMDLLFKAGIEQDADN